MKVTEYAVTVFAHASCGENLTRDDQLFTQAPHTINMLFVNN